MSNQWQPIETAPRDGTWFWVAWKRSRPSTVTFFQSRQAFHHEGGTEVRDFMGDALAWQPRIEPAQPERPVTDQEARQDVKSLCADYRAGQVTWGPHKERMERLSRWAAQGGGE